MHRIILETSDESIGDDEHLTAFNVVRYAQNKGKKSKENLYSMRDLLTDTFGIERHLAVALVCREVKIKKLSDNGSCQFDWPDEGDE